MGSPQYDHHHPTFQIHPESFNGTLDGCIMLTPDQAMWILESTKRHEDEHITHERQKRKVTDFNKHPFLKWDSSSPIIYKFDGTHSEYSRSAIKSERYKVFDTSP